MISSLQHSLELLLFCFFQDFVTPFEKELTYDQVQDKDVYF